MNWIRVREWNKAILERSDGMCARESEKNWKHEWTADVRASSYIFRLDRRVIGKAGGWKLFNDYRRAGKFLDFRPVRPTVSRTIIKQLLSADVCAQKRPRVKRAGTCNFHSTNAVGGVFKMPLGNNDGIFVERVSFR